MKKNARPKLQKKREFRKIRSRIKRRILFNKAFYSRKIKKKYNLLGLNAKIKYLDNREKRIKLFLQFPKDFCYISNPDETSNYINDIQNQLENLDSAHDLHLVYNKTTNIGLAASFVFDQIVTTYQRKWRKKNIRIELSGNFSPEKRVNNFLLSFGILDKLYPLRITNKNYDPDYQTKFIQFLKEGTKKNESDQSIGGGNLVNYFNDCLKFNKFQLTMDAINDFTASITEIIDNAELHSGQDKWAVLGCFDKESNECTFAIINPGRTIYENLRDENSAVAKPIRDLNEFIKSSRNILQKLWDKTQRNFEECLWNIMSLQDGISSKRTEEGSDSTRGQGIMDVLETIELLKSNDPSKEAKISLVSGRSAILIDFKYPIEKIKIGNEFWRRIYFSESKKLNVMPDLDSIVSLKKGFTGTIFTGRYIIDTAHLQEISNKNENN